MSAVVFYSGQLATQPVLLTHKNMTSAAMMEQAHIIRQKRIILLLYLRIYTGSKNALVRKLI